MLELSRELGRNVAARAQAIVGGAVRQRAEVSLAMKLNDTDKQILRALTLVPGVPSVLLSSHVIRNLLTAGAVEEYRPSGTLFMFTRLSDVGRKWLAETA